MPVDRDQLWKAWPAGYLARCGVRTVGGHVCIEGDEKVPDATFYEVETGEVLAFAWELSEDPLWPVLKNGDLLPFLDPADRATWGWALADLDPGAVALRRIKPPYGPGWELWTRRADGEGELYAKRLFLDDTLTPTFDTDEPAVALVTALIRKRESRIW